MKTHSASIVQLAILGLTFLFTACGNNQRPAPSANTPPPGSGLTPFQMENGIGPVKSTVELAAFDAKLATLGQGFFESKCNACHKVEDRYIGPALTGILTKRTPAYVMNMMLNPDEMVKRHPVAKQLLAEYLAPMPFQNVTLDEARAIVEYLRQFDAQPTAASN
jgi:cytochrome c